MWSMELYRTVDGLRLGELPLVAHRWRRSVRDGNLDGAPDGLSESETMGLRWSYDSLDAAGWIDRGAPSWGGLLADLLMPMKHSIMLLRDGVPLAGGPIDDPVSFGATEVSLSVSGIESLWMRRFLVPERFAADRQIHWSGVSLGSIAKRAVELAMEKPSGMLPVEVPVEESARHERTFQAFNVANLDIASVLEKLSDVDGGPDIVFRPKVDGDRFVFDMIVGSARDPWIGQDTVHDFEQGSTDVESVECDVSARYVAHRVYAVGGESDVSTPVRRYDSRIPDGWPLLEEVVSDTDIRYPDEGEELTDAERAKLVENADARLDELGRSALQSFPVVQPRVFVRAGGSTPLGRFWPGELVDVTVHDAPPFEAGTHRWRLLEMLGDSTESVELVFDPVVLGRT